MILRRALCLSVMMLCAASGSALAATPAGLRVGVAKVDITPTDMSLNSVGPNAWVGVHDPLFARALVIANGTDTSAIVSLDLVDLPAQLNALRERIKREVGIPVDHLMISVTHDHSAPHFSGDAPACPVAGAGGGPGGAPGGGPGGAPGGGPGGAPGGGPGGAPGGGPGGAPGGGPQGGPCSTPAKMQAYTKTTSDRIVQALQQAKSDLQPARMGWGSGSADVNVSRDLYTSKGWGMGVNPAGPSNKTVWVAKFETPNGEPIAMLFNYAVHSIVTLDTLMVSGDLAGEAERIVEEHYGNKFVALFTLGAAGDQDPRFPAFPPPQSRSKDVADIRQWAYKAMDAEGFMVGAEVLRVADLINADVTAPRIVAADSSFTCPVAAGKQAEAIDGGVPIQLSLLQIDQVALVGVSGEVVTNIYSHLQKVSPLTNTVMVTITNGRVGYLVDDATYDEPVFEVHGSPAARGCVENGIVDGVVKLIGQNAQAH